MGDAATTAASPDLAVSAGAVTGGAWARRARKAAAARLQAMGLPGRRDEYWKYTDPSALTAERAEPAGLLDEDDSPYGAILKHAVAFEDGKLVAGALEDLPFQNLDVEPLAAAAAADLHWAGDLYGVLEAVGQSPVARPLAALNTATATEGLVIHVTGKAEMPMSLVYRRKDEAADAMVHHLIRLDPGADLTLLEDGPGAARLNAVIEVEIGDGAALHHVRIQGRDHERRASTHLFARLGAGSLLKSFTMTANGALTRNEAVVELAGAGGIAHLAGAAVGDGAFHQDDTVFVTHSAEGCESRQVYKKVLRNGATGVFQGKILVREGAQKTDGYQISQALLLDGDSQFLAKPELEIYADDVACSHGSTSGAIDEEALFYLRSRGIEQSDAQDLLVLAFLAEPIREVENPAIAAEVTRRLEAWLRRHR